MQHRIQTWDLLVENPQLQPLCHCAVTNLKRTIFNYDPQTLHLMLHKYFNKCKQRVKKLAQKITPSLIKSSCEPFIAQGYSV